METVESDRHVCIVLIATVAKNCITNSLVALQKGWIHRERELKRKKPLRIDAES